MFKKWLAILVAVLALPVSGYAQEATIQGVISDTTGAVLPGVSVTVTHEASGNTVTGVTDAKGEYRIPVRTGSNKVTVELSGFTTQTRTVELLVGQQGVVSLQMPTGGVAETITVTGAAPLIDTTQSKLGGNIDPRQLENLPVQGRNFLDLTLLAPGSRANATGDTPGVSFGQFQLNVDGQQITQNCCSGAGGQPKFGQDAIAEFQYVSQFDATQGRSAGVQVNVISKSGTNNGNGSASGYFRDSSVIAKDFITGTVLPYSNQQVNGTYGGPIKKDKAHYFFNYEYEREPGTAVYPSRWRHGVKLQPAAAQHPRRKESGFAVGLPAAGPDAHDAPREQLAQRAAPGQRVRRGGLRDGANRLYPDRSLQRAAQCRLLEGHRQQGRQPDENRLFRSALVQPVHPRRLGRRAEHVRRAAPPRLGHPAHDVHRLFDRDPREYSAAHRPGSVHRPGRLLDVVPDARPPGHQGRRRVSELLRVARLV